ncbi:FMN-dependent NADH-azoreductase [Mycoplasmopsis columbina]|uniref:Fmn-dependent NADH-azoreductase n=1 Tax=Mycoplasmopsis columbina SF7 TaxID=1037410 RepID=F9UKB7_9BACT|nr:FMN-dependent NADH-azoreductase [Mycoplasmopsis columbina]EGV00122.1 fmn-dependent NADH-azoreductase [Mycoplasmopsis columbina SF7]VEU77019.1 FMN-dependent NADH-azoreductase [Mycoplasmopsis columbina]
MQEKKAIRVLSVNGSVNAESLSWAANLTLVDYLLENREKSHLKFLDLNDSPFAKKSLNAKNFQKFFSDGDSDEFIDLLKNTDVLIISSPMINFNYSSLVKNFLDAVCVADKTFSYKYAKQGGSIGLLDHLQVIIIGTQGAPKGWYEFGDHVRALEGTFNFLGAKQIDSLLIAGTKVEPLKSLTQKQILEQYKDQLLALANKVQ